MAVRYKIMHPSPFTPYTIYNHCVAQHKSILNLGESEDKGKHSNLLQCVSNYFGKKF